MSQPPECPDCASKRIRVRPIENHWKMCCLTCHLVWCEKRDKELPEDTDLSYRGDSVGSPGNHGSRAVSPYRDSEE